MKTEKEIESMITDYENAKARSIGEIREAQQTVINVLKWVLG